MQHTDYYTLLGVTQSSSPGEITRAFRHLARQYHPDVSPDDEEASMRFKEINEAYQVLSDPEKREQYDLELASSAPSSYSAASPTGFTSEGQPVEQQQPVVIDREIIEGAVGDLAATMEEVSNQVAGELREILRDFGSELDAITRNFRDTAMRQQGFPPPQRNARPPNVRPPNVRPPSGGRPPRGGRAPKR